MMTSRLPLHGPLLVVLLLSPLVSSQLSCPYGWFGDKCQFQCHCHHDQDCRLASGDCPGLECAVGWFGPQCQYVNVAHSKLIPLLDSNDSTCAVVSRTKRRFAITPAISFTWMRLVTNKAGLFDHVSITFKSNTGRTVIPITNLTRVYMSDTVMDLHGHLHRRIGSVDLRWSSTEVVGSFCSLYVSGGRNVALKQATKMSSIFYDNYLRRSLPSNLAVDGNTRPDLASCSCAHTNPAVSNYWLLNFSRPVLVDRYRLINRANHMWRLENFNLETYSGLKKVQSYHDMQGEKQEYKVYAGTPINPHSQGVTSVNISVSDSYWKNGPPSELSLTLCEVQVYGDSVCAPGRWGPDCEHSCGNCKGDTPCYVSTGSCATGCEPGFVGPACMQRCPDRMYGSGCSKPCSEHCVVDIGQAPSVCHHENGSCLLGCQPKYTGPTCQDRSDYVIHNEIDHTSDEKFTILTAACAASGVVLIGVITLVLVIRRRRRKRSSLAPLDEETLELEIQSPIGASGSSGIDDSLSSPWEEASPYYSPMETRDSTYEPADEGIENDYYVNPDESSKVLCQGMRGTGEGELTLQERDSLYCTPIAPRGVTTGVKESGEDLYTDPDQGTDHELEEVYQNQFEVNDEQTYGNEFVCDYDAVRPRSVRSTPSPVYKMPDFD